MLRDDRTAFRHKAAVWPVVAAGAALMASGSAVAAEPVWVVMPVVSEYPPPGAPTLQRLSREVVDTLSAAVDGTVRAAAHEQRVATCGEGTHPCPASVAQTLGVDRVVSLELRPDLSLAARVVGPDGEVQAHSVTCDWADGRAVCPLDRFADGLGRAAPPPLDPAAVRRVFARARPRLEACLRGDPSAAEVRFWAHPDGRVRHVQVSGPEDRQPCLAIRTESLRVPRFSGRPLPFSFTVKSR